MTALIDFRRDGAPARPINREEMLARLPRCARSILFDKPEMADIKPGLFVDFIREAEWFDFGTVNDAALANASIDAVQFRDGYYIKPPFPISLFRVRQDEPGEDGYACDILFLLIDNNRLRDNAPLVVEVSNGDMEGTTIISFVATRSYLSMSALALVNGPIYGSAGEDDNNVAQLIVKMFEALWLILNTKNIDKQLDEPAPKLNRARVARGKQPLKRVTRISASQYMRALAETVAHGASPRMHLRRAHLRHYTSERFAEAVRSKPKLIEAMIINADKDNMRRDHYEVRT